MGFDKNTEGKPIVQLEKRTTKVNLAMVAAVVLFFIACAFGLVRLHHRAPDHGGNIQPSERQP